MLLPEAVTKSSRTVEAVSELAIKEANLKVITFLLIIDNSSHEPDE